MVILLICVFIFVFSFSFSYYFLKHFIIMLIWIQYTLFTSFSFLLFLLLSYSNFIYQTNELSFHHPLDHSNLQKKEIQIAFEFFHFDTTMAFEYLIQFHFDTLKNKLCQFGSNSLFVLGPSKKRIEKERLLDVSVRDQEYAHAFPSLEMSQMQTVNRREREVEGERERERENEMEKMRIDEEKKISKTTTSMKSLYIQLNQEFPYLDKKIIEDTIQFCSIKLIWFFIWFLLDIFFYLNWFIFVFLIFFLFISLYVTVSSVVKSHCFIFFYSQKPFWSAWKFIKAFLFHSKNGDIKFVSKYCTSVYPCSVWSILQPITTNDPQKRKFGVPKGNGRRKKKNGRTHRTEVRLIW